MIVQASTVAFVLMAASLSGLVARDVIKWLYAEDQKVLARRRAATHLAAILQKYGLVRLPAILFEYGNGDYEKVGENIHDFAKLVLSGDETAVVKEFEQVFSNLLDAKLATEAGRALVASKLADANKPVVAPAAPAALKAPVAA